MNKILFVNACIRPNSRTRMLAQHVLDKLDGEITEVNLEKENIQPLNLKSMNEREALAASGDFSDDVFKYARQFKEADTVVIAAPFWDLSFPSMVKVYCEAVTVNGLTFHYTEQGFPEGLTNVDKVIYVTTAGGPIADFNLGFDYVSKLCQMLFSIKDVTCHKAEMLDVIGADVEGILDAAIKEIEGTTY